MTGSQGEKQRDEGERDEVAVRARQGRSTGRSAEGLLTEGGGRPSLSRDGGARDEDDDEPADSGGRGREGRHGGWTTTMDEEGGWTREGGQGRVVLLVCPLLSPTGRQQQEEAGRRDSLLCSF